MTPERRVQIVRRFRNEIGRSRGYGACYRCGDTWNHATSHETPYSPAAAMFPLCESCWTALTPDERLPHYRALWECWVESGSSVRWTTVEAAVYLEAARG